MIPTVYIHHDTYNLPGRHLFTVDAWHRKEGYPLSSFGYHTFYQHFIEKDGLHIQTRANLDLDVVFKKAHLNSITICLAGNFDKHYPTKRQLGELVKLLVWLRHEYGIGVQNIKEHRDYQNTSCPGSNITKGFFALLFLTAEYPALQKLFHWVLLKLRGII